MQLYIPIYSFVPIILSTACMYIDIYVHDRSVMCRCSVFFTRTPPIPRGLVRFQQSVHFNVLL